MKKSNSYLQYDLNETVHINRYQSSKTGSFNFLQMLELNLVCINNAQCTWWPTPKKLQQRTATEELSITWCSRDLKSFKDNSKIQYWFPHVLDYNSWLLRNFLKSWISRSFVIILLRTGFFRKVYRGRIDLVTIIQILVPAISNYNWRLRYVCVF